MEASQRQMQQLGARLRERRKALNVTQLSLAEMCSLAPNTIINLERGTGNARLETLFRITDVLGLSLDFVPKRLS
ncbi:MAG: helix-turn-helix domain-containing protein [Saprospiraceae bacterium]